jgi:protein-L-isoaspartate(D-aspartate) O-methyltransferase
VVHGDGTRIVFEPVDVIYVNAGATRPADAWLDRLKERGRLILPLTADGFPNRDVRRGVVFRIERCGTEFFARRISGVAIFPVRAVVTRPANRHSLWPSTRAAPSA